MPASLGAFLRRRVLTRQQLTRLFWLALAVWLLWLTLREPGPVPRYVWADDPDAAATGLTSLVLDGVRDVAHGDGFVTGAAAAPAMMAAGEVRASGRLGQLSRTALRWAEALLPLDPADLASRLYQFGRAPRTAARARGKRASS